MIDRLDVSTYLNSHFEFVGFEQQNGKVGLLIKAAPHYEKNCVKGTDLTAFLQETLNTHQLLHADGTSGSSHFDATSTVKLPKDADPCKAWVDLDFVRTFEVVRNSRIPTDAVLLEQYASQFDGLGLKK